MVSRLQELIVFLKPFFLIEVNLAMRFILLVSLFVTLISCSYSPPKTWENIKFTRTIDLSKSYIKEQYRITLKNIDSKPNGEYYLSLPSYVYDKLVSYTIVDPQPKSFVNDLATMKIEASEKFADVKGERVINFLRVHLPHPIAPKQTFQLGVSLTISDLLEPIPSKIEIADTQSLLLKTFKEPLSPYDTKDALLDINGVSKGKELSISGQEIKNKGEVVDDHVHYKFGKVRSYSMSSLAFVYSHNLPLVKVTNLNRSVWVSHWGNSLQFDEFYKMTNKAAQLKNGFSRKDFMLNQKTLTRSSFSISALEMRLLDESRDIYYTDLVGNVSTSKAFNDRVYIKPRYPIFGGWNYNFTIGWTNKLSAYLRQSDPNEYILKFPILSGPQDTSYDEVNLSVYLPEGAKIKDIYSPIPYDHIEEGYELSYLDLNSGHTKITLTYTNLVDELNEFEIIVKYEYTLWDFIRKPLDIAKFVFIALISYLLISKIDISLKAKK